ncbi:hypothetical protein AN618_21580 [Fervidicola ferrireducens]|uniref:Uncharacterized protein n=2 Tax=Fervidicola ferrireducens TaxID=520764 RepID=A0A140L2U1_9FIRM|nr:hypothetical protein AN618_21580 [Fervidicola ferrireducens]
MEKEEILKGLERYKAMTIEQVIDVILGGEARRGYYLVDRLRKEKMVRVERVPWDAKKKYAVLTRRGAEEVKGRSNIKTHEYYVKREELEEILKANEIFRITKKVGVDEIIGRREALEELKIPANKSSVKWMVDVCGRRYAIYIRDKWGKEMAEKGMLNSMGKDMGHIVVYEKREYYNADRRDWLTNMPAAKLYLVMIEEMGEMLRMLKEQEVVWRENVGKLKVHVGSGELVKLKDAPVRYAWEKNGKRMLLSDVTDGNVHEPAMLMKRTKEELKERWGAEGVVFFVRGVKEARVWGRLLGYKEFHYFLAKDEGDLYRALGGKVVLMRKGGDSDQVVTG